jgi:hypothetical protein
MTAEPTSKAKASTIAAHRDAEGPAWKAGLLWTPLPWSPRYSLPILALSPQSTYKTVPSSYSGSQVNQNVPHACRPRSTDPRRPRTPLLTIQGVPNRTTNCYIRQASAANSLMPRYCATHRRHLRSILGFPGLSYPHLKTLGSLAYRSFLVRRKALSPSVDHSLHCTHDRLIMGRRTSTTPIDLPRNQCRLYLRSAYLTCNGAGTELLPDAFCPRTTATVQSTLTWPQVIHRPVHGTPGNEPSGACS